jgi:hypothetical protein
MARPKSCPVITPADVLPFLSRTAHIEGNVVVTSHDTAYTLGAYLSLRRYRTSQKRKAYDARRHQDWVERNREHVREYNREWKRRSRAA